MAGKHVSHNGQPFWDIGSGSKRRVYRFLKGTETTWWWCARCWRVFKAPRWDRPPNIPENSDAPPVCPFEGCPGERSSLVEWEKIAKERLGTPTEPIEGWRYPLY